MHKILQVKFLVFKAKINLKIKFFFIKQFFNFLYCTFFIVHSYIYYFLHK